MSNNANDDDSVTGISSTSFRDDNGDWSLSVEDDNKQLLTKTVGFESCLYISPDNMFDFIHNGSILD